MNRLIKFFVDNWRFSFLVSVLILIVGAISLNLLRKESFPPVNFAAVVIVTIYPGASPEEVQDRVTKEIESELKGIDGLKRVKSTSRSETSEILVEIDIDTKNTKDIITDIQSAVQRASGQLPAGISEDPRITEIKAEELPVYEFGIIGPNVDRARDKIIEKIEDKLDDIPQVKDASLNGYSKKELHILINPNKLKENQLSLSEIIASLSTQLKNSPSGFIDTKKEISLVRVIGQKSSLEEISNLVIRSNDSGQAIRIKDVANVTFGTDRPKVLARINGEEASLFVVTKKAEADTITLVNNLEIEIAKIKKNLPPEYKLVVYNDEGSRVKNRLDIVNFNAISGIIIVLLVLFLFLPGKVGAFSAMSLPLCALGTVTFMIWQGAQFNIITMIALVICLGNLVDNSVVISEYYTQLIENGEDPRKSAIKAARKFWVPFAASTITIISSFLPMLVTQGVFGQFIRWIPIVVTIALTLSLFESITLLPARLQFLKPVKKIESSQNWFSKFEDLFARTIKKSLEMKWLTLGSILALIISGFMMNGLFNRFELFPAEGVEYYVGRFELKSNSSIYKTDEVGKKLNFLIKEKIPAEALTDIVTRVGEAQTDPSDSKGAVGENVGIMIIGIKPDFAPKMDIQKMLADLRSIPKFDEIEKLSFEPIENGPPVGKPLTLTIRSTQENQLNQLVDELLTEFNKIPGIIDLDTDAQKKDSEYQFHLDPKKLSYSGVNAESLALTLSTALKGTPVATLTDEGRKFDAVVQLDGQFISELKYLNSIEILNQFNQYVPLQKLGNFEVESSVKTIKNFNFQRSITITSDVNVSQITSASLNEKARKILLEKIVKYPEVSFIFGGEEESTNESLQSLFIALIISIFGIFATLVFTFKSFLKPLVILSSIPLGLVGVFYAFTLGQRPLSFLAFIGIVGLSGVVINSAIILVDYIEELRNTRPDLDLKDILILASKNRLRAVLATGITTVVGLLPTAFGWGGYDSILVPITLSLSWGMIIGTVLTLIWIPSLYLVLFNKKAKI